MQNERKRILTMLENGTISMDEALTLLEAMDQTGRTQQAEPGAKTGPEQERPSAATEETYYRGQNADPNSTDQDMDDFIDDLKKDFFTVGDRFMQFMQSAVERVKDFDFEKPFKGGTLFHHTESRPAADITEMLLDIDHGSVTIETAEDAADEIKAEFTVRNYNKNSEEEAKKEFMDKLIFAADEGKLSVMSDLKLNQVNVKLIVPDKQFQKISAKMLNGQFFIKDTKVKTLYVKTANGKMEVLRSAFNHAELEAGNGSVRVIDSEGASLEAETINGRVYIDGKLKVVEAKSLNGHVVVTTTDESPESVEAKTVSGSVELYIPSSVGLRGEISSNMGKLDLQLDDVQHTTEHEQFLQRSMSFRKDAGTDGRSLHISGETKTGSVIVCYNVNHDKNEETASAE